MMKKLSLLFIIIGLLIIGYSAFQIVQGNMKQKVALSEATNITQIDENMSTAYKLKPTYDDSKPLKGDTVGILEINKIEAKLPIIEGTDEEELDIGVGHLKDTVYPTQNEQLLLSAHR